MVITRKYQTKVAGRGPHIKDRGLTFSRNDQAIEVNKRFIIDMGLRWLSRQSDVLPPLRSWVRSLYRASHRTWEEFVNTQPKVVGFLQVLRFPPTGKVDLVG